MHTDKNTDTGYYTGAGTHKKTHTFSEDLKKALARKNVLAVWSRAQKLYI